MGHSVAFIYSIEDFPGIVPNSSCLIHWLFYLFKEKHTFFRASHVAGHCNRSGGIIVKELAAVLMEISIPQPQTSGGETLAYSHTVPSSKQSLTPKPRRVPVSPMALPSASQMKLRFLRKPIFKTLFLSHPFQPGPCCSYK